MTRNAWVGTFLGLILAGGTVFAQADPGPGPDGGGGGGPNDRQGPPPRMRDGGQGGMNNDRPRPGPPEMARIFDAYRGYIELVDRYTKVARDPSTAGIAAVITATDILKARGPEPAIDYLTKLLPDVKSAAVQRAIRLSLADLYKASGQSDKALEQLRILMTTDVLGAEDSPAVAPAAKKE